VFPLGTVFTHRRASPIAWAATPCLSRHQTFRLAFALLVLVCSFVSVATAAEKTVLFIHTNKSNASGVILFDKTFKAELGGTQTEAVILYNEYTYFWQFAGDDYVRSLNDFYKKKYAGHRFDLASASGPRAVVLHVAMAVWCLACLITVGRSTTEGIQA